MGSRCGFHSLPQNTRHMVFLESLCAAAFGAGSAVCLVKLLSPQQQALDNNAPFVATLLITCLIGAFALWTVKGPHACWHPYPGSSWSSRKRATAPTKAEGGVVQPAKDVADGDGVEVDPAAGTAKSQEAETIETSAMTAVDGGADVPLCEDAELPLEDIRLERRSSFVVSATFRCEGRAWPKQRWNRLKIGDPYHVNNNTKTAGRCISRWVSTNC